VTAVCYRQFAVRVYRSSAVDITLMTMYQRRDRVALSERVDACQIASITEMHPGARDSTAMADYSTAVNETRESTGKKRQRRQFREDEVI